MLGKITKIQWTKSSWNPWQGCTKVSPECDNCYMYTDKKRYGQNPSIVIRSSDATFYQPLKSWKEPTLIFICSWSDFFHKDADIWRDEAWDIIRKTPYHIYQILTKRPERIKKHIPTDWPFDNVCLGSTVGIQRLLDQRMSSLIESPTGVRFLSMEPLLEPVDLSNWLSYLNWVIVGGESGSQARPMNLDWARQIVRQCQEYEVPVFVKQLGTHWAKTTGTYEKGNSKAEMIELWPDDLRVQEYPEMLYQVHSKSSEPKQLNLF